MCVSVFAIRLDDDQQIKPENTVQPKRETKKLKEKNLKKKIQIEFAEQLERQQQQ